LGGIQTLKVLQKVHKIVVAH